MAIAADEVLSEVLAVLRERAGIEPETLGTPGIAHALRNRMTTAGVDSPRDYLRRLLADAEELQALLEQVVVPETWFFRDLAAFRCAERHLEARRSRIGGPVRVLSAACSTGEEVYSLAMILRQSGLEPPQLRIQGADLSRRSLELAQEGAYTQRSFREADDKLAALCERWLQRAGDAWRVRDELRAGVEFRWGNLVRPDFLAGEPPFEVIFCRNLLIYFDAEARRAALGNLHRLLGPEGLLCCGPAEARIFGEAGLLSLGAECPFAFRRPEGLSVAIPAAALGALPQSTATRGSDGKKPSRPQVAARGGHALASGNRVGRDVAAARVPMTAASPAAEDASEHALLRAAQQAADGGGLDRAEDLCRQVLARNPACAEATYLRGVVRQAQGAVTEAQKLFEKALYLDPTHYQALVHLMLLAEQRGDRRAAANYRRRARRNAPKEAD